MTTLPNVKHFWDTALRDDQHFKQVQNLQGGFATDVACCLTSCNHHSLHVVWNIGKKKKQHSIHRVDWKSQCQVIHKVWDEVQHHIQYAPVSMVIAQYLFEITFPLQWIDAVHVYGKIDTCSLLFVPTKFLSHIPNFNNLITKLSLHLSVDDMQCTPFVLVIAYIISHGRCEHKPSNPSNKQTLKFHCTLDQLEEQLIKITVPCEWDQFLMFYMFSLGDSLPDNVSLIASNLNVVKLCGIISIWKDYRKSFINSSKHCAVIDLKHEPTCECANHEANSVLQHYFGD